MSAAIKRRMTAHHADAAYGVRHGTCKALYVAGKVRGVEQRGRGGRKTLFLFTPDLDRVLAGVTP